MRERKEMKEDKNKRCFFHQALHSVLSLCSMSDNPAQFVLAREKMGLLGIELVRYVGGWL